MHDSRVGNFGVMSGIAALLIKFVALSSAPYALLQLAVIIVPVWARWSECFAIGNFKSLACVLIKCRFNGFFHE